MTEPQTTAVAAAFSCPPNEVITVVTMEESRCGMAAYSRRDLFKAVLVLEGTNELHYATRSYTVDKPALVFTNRLVPYSWEVTGSGEQQGYICAFSEAFLQAAMRGVSLKDSVLYRADGNPVYFLSDEQLRYLTEAFARLHRDRRSDYAHKHELLRNQLSIIIHEATRLQPASATAPPAINAAERITNLFLTLLDAQFPVTTPGPGPILRKASEYADRMAIHVNYLNAALKEVTGQSTTEHLNQRMVTEARLLLTTTDWDVAEIAYSLGFEYASYFNSFFKKHTGHTPLTFRRAQVAA